MRKSRFLSLVVTLVTLISTVLISRPAKAADGQLQFDFPWPAGVSHTFTSGPHGYIYDVKTKKSYGCLPASNCAAEVPVNVRSGLDFGGNNWDVRPVADGTVIKSGFLDSIAGSGVWVDHGDGWVTKYIHMNPVGLRPLGPVTRNDSLGRTACSGSGCGNNSNNAHLHIDLQRWNNRVSWHGLVINGWTFSADTLNYNGWATRCDVKRVASISGTASFVAGDPIPTCSGSTTPNANITNLGFETGDFTGWQKGQVTQSVDVVQSDSFTSPYEGKFMVRLGNSGAQAPGPNEIMQDFVVKSAEERFVYNIFTYDYTGFDEFRFSLKVINPSTGELLAAYQQGAWGSGTNLKTSGWRGVSLDLAGHLNQTVRLVLSAGGTSDSLYPFWAYIDSAQSGLPPVVAPLGNVKTDTGSVSMDPQTGAVTIGMPSGNKSDLTISSTVKCPGSGFPSNVGLNYNGLLYQMSLVIPTVSTYSVTIPAAFVGTGVLTIQATCPSGNFVNTIGSVQLYDPSGTITDIITGQPIVGAEVHLYTVPGWTPKTGPEDTSPTSCQSHASKPADSAWNQLAPADEGMLANPYIDPMEPKVNPFITNEAGKYGWDVGMGCWFVVVIADGYEPLISPVVGVPEAVTDLNLTLSPITDEPEDTTPPTVTVTGFTHGDVFTKGMPQPTVGCAADDGDGSGVAVVSDPVLSAGGLNANGVGSMTYTCSSTDAAGNSATSTATYRVIYAFGGFQQPVEPLPTTNTVKAGSAIPVKFSLSGNHGLGIFAVGFPKAQILSCNTSVPADDIETTATAGNSSLSYDAVSDTYTYVWKTEKAWGGTCRQLLLQLNDGEIYRANFALRK